MGNKSTKEMRYAMRSAPTNVISMQLDAAYFYQRGVKYLQRNDLKRALKAFRKTVEYEPENPVNHCNLAGVLSELGDFEASNQVLMHVLKELDPGMSECQFYLANNYANMGQYDIAEEYVLRYLDAEPDGEYAEDAEEMLTILMGEFGGGKAYESWEQKRQEQERDAAKRDGRHLLEEGQFEAAVEWLEAVLERDDGNTAAKNNLSLAYFYTGHTDKAVRLSENVLEENPHNIHALCNLAVFSTQVGPKERLAACVDKLSKVFPLHYDQAMKIGTTLGLIGEHAIALNVFDRLSNLVESLEPALIHSLAAASANVGRLQSARRWWKMLEQDPSMTEVAEYYLTALDATVRQGKRALRVSYQCDLPMHVQFARMKKRLHEGDLTLWRKDPLLRASLYWGLRHGTGETRRAVIRTLALIADEDANQALRLFLKRRDLDDSLRAAALFALHRTGAHGRVEYWHNMQLESKRMSEIDKDVILEVEPIWGDIWRQTEAWLKDHHKSRLIGECKRIWLAFLEQAFIRSDVRIVKSEVWVAGLLYVVGKRHQHLFTQKDVAQAFNVSASSVSKAAVRLEWFALRLPGL